MGALKVRVPARIAVECLRCGHAAILPALADADVALATITKRFVCSACGSRAVKAKRR